MLNITLTIATITFSSILFYSIFIMPLPKKSKTDLENKIHKYKLIQLAYGLPSLAIAGYVLYNEIIILYFSNLTSSQTSAVTSTVIGVVFALIAITISQTNRIDDKIEALEEKLPKKDDAISPQK